MSSTNLYILIHLGLLGLCLAGGPRTLTGHFRNEDGAELDIVCTGTAGPAQLKGWLDFNTSTQAHAFPMLGYATGCDPGVQLSMSVPGSNSQAGNENWALSLTGQVEDTYPLTMRMTVVRVSYTLPELAWQAFTVQFFEFYKVETTGSSTTIS